MAVATGVAPIVDLIRARVPAEGTAGTGGEYVVGYVEYAATVTAVRYMPDSAVTGAATNHKRLSVVNKGTAGSGTTEAAGLALDNGVNAAAFDAKDITLSGTAANRDVAEGSVITFKSTVVASGIALPAATVEVELARN